jgi:DNA-binding CsgD family transcriptional regulator
MPNEGQISVGASGEDFGLTPLEKQAIALNVAGYSHRESAEQLGVSRQELRLQLEGICNKLRVSNQFELLLFALYHQLVDSCGGSESSESAYETELTIINVVPVQQT